MATEPFDITGLLIGGTMPNFPTDWGDRDVFTFFDPSYSDKAAFIILEWEGKTYYVPGFYEVLKFHADASYVQLLPHELTHQQTWITPEWCRDHGGCEKHGHN